MVTSVPNIDPAISINMLIFGIKKARNCIVTQYSILKKKYQNLDLKVYSLSFECSGGSFCEDGTWLASPSSRLEVSSVGFGF